MNKTSIDSAHLLSSYIFDFEKLFSHKECFQTFFKFAQQEFNTDCLFFIQEVNELETLTFPAKQAEAVKLANHIFETYIQSGSSACATKKKLCKIYHEAKQMDNDAVWLLTNHFPMPALAFAELKHQIMLELKSDSFPRFLRSKLWMEFSKKQDKYFFTNFAVPKASTVYNYKEEDFGEGSIVTDADFEFAQDWELQAYSKIGDSGYVSAYYCNRNYFPQVEWSKKAAVFKIVGVLPFAMDFVAHSLISLEAICEYESYAHSSKEVSYLNNQELRDKYPDKVKQPYRGLGLQQLNLQFPFPTNQIRRMQQAVSVMYDPAVDRIVYIQKATAFKNNPLPAKWLDIHSFNMVQFTALDNNRTMFVQTIIFNAHGWASQALNKLSCGYRAKQIATNFVRFLKDEQDGKYKHLTRSDPLARCLVECDMQKRKIH